MRYFMFIFTRQPKPGDPDFWEEMKKKKPK